MSSQPQPSIHQPSIYPQIIYTQTLPQVVNKETDPPRRISMEPLNTPIHRQWSSNLCDCCIDCKTCLHAFICPCVAFAKVSNHTISETQCCKGCGRSLCCCLLPCSVFIRAPYRKKLRVKYNLPAKPCNDFCTTLCCPCCHLAQELREINYQTNVLPKLEQMKI